MKRLLFPILSIFLICCGTTEPEEEAFVYGTWRIGRTTNGVHRGYFELVIVEEDPFMVDSVTTADGHFTHLRADTAIVPGVTPLPAQTIYGYYNLTYKTLTLSGTRVRTGDKVVLYDPPLVDLLTYELDGAAYLDFTDNGPDYFFGGWTATLIKYQ